MGSSTSDLKSRKTPKIPKYLSQGKPDEKDSDNESTIPQEGPEKFEDISSSDLGGIINPQSLKTSPNVIINDRSATPPTSSRLLNDHKELITKNGSSNHLVIEKEPPYDLKKPSTVVPLPKIVPSPTHTECDLVSTKVTPTKRNAPPKAPLLEFPELNSSKFKNHFPTFSPSEVRISTAVAAEKRNLTDLKLEELS